MNTISKIFSIVFSLLIGITSLEATTLYAVNGEETKTHASAVAAQVSSEQKEVIALHFNTILNNATVTICDMYGEIVSTVSDVNGKDVYVDQNGLNNAPYYFQIEQKNKTNIIGKLLVH